MTKNQLARKASQLVSTAAKLESIINSLPQEFKGNNNWKSELNVIIRAVDRAAA